MKEMFSSDRASEDQEFFEWLLKGVNSPNRISDEQLLEIIEKMRAETSKMSFN